MKRLKFAALAFATLAFFSCEKEEITQNQGLTSESTTLQPLSTSNVQSTSPCGSTMEQTLYAGQNINAGTVSVSNDADNLYVTYSTTNGWEMAETHLYVGDCTEIPTAGNGNPQIGLFPFTTDHNPTVTSYTYTIPLADLEDCYCVAAHTALVQYDSDGNVISSETGWADGDQINGGNGGSWAMSFEYCTQECDESNNQTCYQEETAWVDGDDYTNQGSWATYTSYNGTAMSETIFAGQTLNAGTASFSAPDSNGDVTITITLNSGWSLQNVTEPVKIQGYENAPSGNPSPGTFTTYTGSDLTITVPAYDFYGIHLDVQKEISCE